MKFGATLLATVGFASLASAETCSGFETRLSSLQAQVQQMVDIVDALPPSNYPQCGGIVGAKIDIASFLVNIPTGPSSINPTRRYDHQWCCEQCMEYDGCKYWSLQMRGLDVNDESKMRCQLYADNWNVAERTAAQVPNGSPGGFLFPVGLGVGVPNDGAKRVSGVVPEMGRWGGHTDTSSLAALKNPANYMVDIELNGPGGSVTLAWNNVTGDPNAPMEEGFEMCDSLGAFKADTLPNDGNPVLTRARHPLECCSMCVRNGDMDGNHLSSPCVMWTYNYDPRRRQCITRDASYDALGGMDVNQQAGRDYFQMHSVCARYDNDGNQRYHPDGTTPCAGTFPARRWSSGNTNARGETELRYLVTGA